VFNVDKGRPVDFSMRNIKVYQEDFLPVVAVVVDVSWVDEVVPLLLVVVLVGMEVVLNAVDVTNVLVACGVLVLGDEVVVWLVDVVKGDDVVGTVVVELSNVVVVVISEVGLSYCIVVVVPSVLVVAAEVLDSNVEVPVDWVEVLVGLLLVAIEEVVVGNKVVDVSLVLVVGDVANVELVCECVVVAGLEEAVKDTINWQ